ncbi:VOC family protein [Blautia liquoris]|uniref:VOC family protein n=1 Tax=Blautia liquoris TaxID=2779518 RepID=A0A7M2RFL5_9FIRM|nr:VOC family protein [Blautia liquoris]QOV18120.1 VOC family protein [Blautia liquoris]
MPISGIFRMNIMSLNISVNFDGNCREAVTFYAQVFEQPIPYFLTYEEGEHLIPSKMQIPDSMKSRVMRTSLNIAGTSVEFYDIPDAFGFIRGNSTSLSVAYKDYSRVKRISDLLSQDGEVEVACEQPDEGMYYGILEDKFQIRWLIRTQELERECHPAYCF